MSIPTKIGEANTGDNSFSDSSSNSPSPSPSPSSSPALPTKIVYVESMSEKTSCFVSTKAWRIYVYLFVLMIVLSIILYFSKSEYVLVPIVIATVVMSITGLIAFFSSIWFSFTDSPCK